MKAFIAFVALAFLSGLLYPQVSRLGAHLSPALRARLPSLLILALCLLLTLAFFLNKL